MFGETISEKVVNAVYNLLKIKVSRLSIKDRVKFFLNMTNPLYRFEDGSIIYFSVEKDGSVVLKCCDKEVRLPLEFEVRDVREALYQLKSLWFYLDKESIYGV